MAAGSGCVRGPTRIQPAESVDWQELWDTSGLHTGLFLRNEDFTMKKLMMTFSLLLTLGLSTTGVAAQNGTPEPETNDIEYSEVEGLQSSYERTFFVDFDAVALASPETDFEDLDMAEMMRLIGIEGLTFDSEDNASAYLQRAWGEFDSEAADNEEMMEGVEITELEGFGVDGMRMTMQWPDLEVTTVVVILMDGNHVFQVMVVDTNPEAAESKIDEIIQFVLDADIENDEITFNMDGASTGGVFDRMPSSGDEIVGDLMDVWDTELFTEGAE